MTAPDFTFAKITVKLKTDSRAQQCSVIFLSPCPGNRRKMFLLRVKLDQMMLIYL